MRIRDIFYAAIPGIILDQVGLTLWLYPVLWLAILYIDNSVFDKQKEEDYSKHTVANGSIQLLLPAPKRLDPDSQEYMERYAPKA